jgi:sugar transferase (PEP-CTERM/EpsH1 system associated)
VRLLFLSQRVPEPPNKGDKIRSHHLARRLAARHEVHLAFLLDEPSERADAERAATWAASCRWRVRSRLESAGRGALAAATGAPMSAGWFRSAALARDVGALLRARAFDAVVAYCSSMAPYAREFAGPRVLDLVDVDSEKWRQYADRAAFPRRAVYAHEHRLLRAFERRLVREFDRTVVVSRAEREVLATFADAGRVAVVGNGVDADGFARPHARPREPRLVFVGALDYFANVDGIIHFVRETWPDVRRAVSGARLAIVGRRPGGEVRALAGADGVEVVADPEDVRPWVWGAAACVVPLRIAQGTQNKVLEAMAAGVPVVATSAALRGIEGEAGRHFRVADASGAWVAALGDLLSRPEEADALAERARRLVVERYSWDRQAERYEEEIRNAVESRSGRAPGGSP